MKHNLNFKGCFHISLKSLSDELIWLIRPIYTLLLINIRRLNQVITFCVCVFKKIDEASQRGARTKRLIL